MKIKCLFLLGIVLFMFTQNAVADKVRSIFYECSFGMSAEQMKETLTKAKLDPIVGSDGNIYIKDMLLDVGTFKIVCMMTSPVDGKFYKLIGTNNYKTEEAADSCYNASMARLRELHPNLQIVRHPNNAVKLCSYPDEENIVVLGMYKKQDEDGKTAFYVNINYWNKYSSKKIRQAR